MSAPTKRELELELQVWQERKNTIQNGVAALNAQGQLLQIQSREAHDNIERLTNLLKADGDSNATDQTTPAEPAPPAT